MIDPPCPYDGSVCEVQGAGFRGPETTPWQYAIDDFPCDKIALCPSLDILLLDDPHGGWVMAQANDFSAQPAAVPIPSAGALMITLLAVAFVVQPMWDTARRFGDWFTKERG